MLPKNKYQPLILILITGLLISCVGSSARVYGGRDSDPVPLMNAIRTGKLPNGLSYYILENSKPENRAYLTLAVRAGSVLEQEDEQGLAHFVEHMAFEGTARFPRTELVDYLRSLGMRFGPEVNAYTSYDETVYGIEVPVEEGRDGVKRIPDRALAVIDDWTHAVTFDPGAVDNERKVILEEYRTRLGASERTRRRFLTSLFADSKYAERFPIGLPEIISDATVETLVNFYRSWYRSDNMAIILIGDFDSEILEASLAAHFSMMPPDSPLDHPNYDLTPPQKGRLIAEIIADPEQTSTRVSIYQKRKPQAMTSDLRSYREDLIDSLIDSMASLRFEEAVSKSETPYTHGGSGVMHFGHSAQFYVFSAVAKQELAASTLEALLREKESMARYGYTQAELERAKASIKSNLEQAVSEKDRQESGKYIDSVTYHYTNGYSLPDVEWELETVNLMLPNIREKDIVRRIKEYFSEDDISIYIIAPNAEIGNLPGVDDIKKMAADVKRMKIEAPKKERIESSLLEDKIQPGRITGESRDEELGAILWELDNGARVVLKETANKNNEIVLYAIAPGGLTSASLDELVSVRLASEIQEASGAGPYSRAELVKRLAGKQITFGSWTSSFTRGLQATSTNDDLKALFEILYLFFSQPRIDEDASAVILDQYRTRLAQRSENPQNFFFDEVRKILYSGNPWFNPLQLEDLARLSTSQIRAFLQRALNAGDYTFVFTGNINAAVLRPLVETYIASIPNYEEQRNSFTGWKDLQISRPGKTTHTIYKGLENQSIVCLAWFVPYPFTETASAVAETLSEYLDIVLTEEIRGKLGGVYSISPDVGLISVPRGELAMTVYFFCDPNRTEELIRAVEAELGSIARGDLNRETVAKAIEALKMSHQQAIQSNNYLARNIAQYPLLLGLPPSRINHKPELYEKVRPADLTRIAALLLPQGPMKVILYPESRR